MSPKAKKTKTNGTQLNLKDFAQQWKPSTKRLPTEWKKIFANITDKGLLSTIYRQLIHFISKKIHFKF